ncbi:hypothetical protein [Segatella bryantii]|uniref:Uncharacterized protein n=1 Tax=Segatella bryantii TaxID=77095 RepID=A0ABX4EGQ2_SEGBR|nr:hypothetical protein [Segatella bryantii]OYP54913.1 hypothetical protein CIK91_08295 [Segatella bryantii]UKK82054.1 hypothetical protein L6474_13210 [Segatella bryantii]
MGVVPSADGHVSQLSPLSNDSNNVGKSVTDERTNDEPSAQQGGQSLNPNSTSSDGSGDYCQKPNGYNRSNGFQSDN